MTRINMIICDTCNKKCDNLKDSYFQVNRYDPLNDEFFEEAINNKNNTIIEVEDYEKHFCSIKCLKKYFNKNEQNRKDN